MYNKGNCAIDISCYVLVYSSTFSGFPTGWSITIPSNTIIQPCQYYLIGGGGGTAVGVWQNTSGGSNWINVGSYSRDPDLPIKNASSTVLNTTVGLLLDAGGQVSLLDQIGAQITSVAWGTGNNSSSYNNSFSNPDAGCTKIQPLINPGSSANYNAYNTPVTGRQGLYLSSLGTYIVETSLTPGYSNDVNGGSQISCSGSLIAGSHDTNPVTACINYNPPTLIFTTSPSGGTTPYSYQWKINGVNIPGATANTYDPPNLTTAGTYEYNVEITDACGTKVTTAIKTITIVADPIVFMLGGGYACH